jgi:hypothetical protein
VTGSTVGADRRLIQEMTGENQRLMLQRATEPVMIAV